MDIWIPKLTIIVERSENEYKTVSHMHQFARLTFSKATDFNAKDQE